MIGPVLGAPGTPLDPDKQAIIKKIALKGHPNAVVVTDDLARVFVATDNGIDLIDGFTMTYFGHIGVGPDGNVTALTVSPDGKTLYAALTGAILVIDVNSRTELGKFDNTKDLGYTRKKIILSTDLPNNTGYISTIEINADGTRLFAGAPGSRFFGGANSIAAGGLQKGVVLVINTDEHDRPTGKPNPQNFQQVIARIPGGLETWKITKTSDPLKMLFTSRGDVTKGRKDASPSGLHTIEIDAKNNDPSKSIGITVKTIGLGVNLEIVDVRLVGTPGPNGFDTSQFTQRATHQGFDLDIRNATGVAILADLTYAFVADYYLPRIYYDDAQRAFDIESLHKTGSKIGIIKDPFGPKPELVASTTPIPSAYIDELVLSRDGTKLYANYRLTGNILVFDVKAITKFLNEAIPATLTELKRFPIDSGRVGSPNLNKPAIDVPKFERGLALQQISAITLEGPTGEHDVDSAAAADLEFTWKVDVALLGINFFKSNLYVSAENAGTGLWPDDPITPRTDNLLGTGVQPNVIDPSIDPKNDVDPARIFTSTQQKPGGLVVGFHSLHQNLLVQRDDLHRSLLGESRLCQL